MAGQNELHHHHQHQHRDHGGHDAAVMIEQLELEGAVFGEFLVEAADQAEAVRGRDLGPIRRILDIGSGPGIGTIQFAQRFPDATVTAVDSSEAMLDAVRRRAAVAGLDARVATRLAELPGGMDGVGRADLIWASMSIHHVGDEVAAISLLASLLDDHGVIAIAEMEGSMQMISGPADDDLGELVGHLDGAWGSWFADMRSGLAGYRPSQPLATMVERAGLSVAVDRLLTVRVPAMIGTEGHRIAVRRLIGARARLADRLDPGNLAMLDALLDENAADCIHVRQDLALIASRRLVVAHRR